MVEQGWLGTDMIYVVVSQIMSEWNGACFYRESDAWWGIKCTTYNNDHLVYIH